MDDDLYRAMVTVDAYIFRHAEESSVVAVRRAWEDIADAVLTADRRLRHLESENKRLERELGRVINAI